MTTLVLSWVMKIKKHLCYVRDTDGVDLIKGSCGSNLYTISVEDMMKSSPICLLSKASKNKSWLWHRRLNHLNFGTINDLCRHFYQKSVLRTPQQNDVVKRQNRTLVEAARTMLIFSKALMFLWAEAVATACYTQNRSLIHTRHNKTPYELVHDKKPDLTFLRVFGALCYPTNDSKDIGKLQPTADIGIFVGYAPSRKGLVPNLVHAAPYVPPINKELEILFKLMFDEYLDPPHVERPVSSAIAVQVLVISAGIPSSTTIDQDAPSPSHSLLCLELQPPISHQGVAVGSTIIEDNPFAHVDNDPFVNVFAPEPSSKASSSRDERIEKTKRSKNDQKPTRNGKKTKSQEQDKEISQKSQPDQPDTVKDRNKESQRVKLQVKGPKLSSVQSFKCSLEVLKIKGLKLPKEKVVL
ncbi:integrase, catalytic region, zinc finger, CCHC-type containing protein [Tanacetum coccineum]